MSKSYTINFSSRNALDNSNLNAVKFYVNWASILPVSEYKSYECSFVFKSEAYSGILTNIGYVNINIGRTEVYDCTTQTNNIGLINPVAIGTSNSYYNATSNDNNTVVLYPGTDGNITIKLNNFSGAALANMQHYVLVLNMTPLHSM
jgi:hypothetical protein